MRPLAFFDCITRALHVKEPHAIVPWLLIRARLRVSAQAWMVSPKWTSHAQGFNRVSVNAGLNTSQSMLEILGSWVVLALWPPASVGRLAALGAVSIACASLSAIVGARPLNITSPKTSGLFLGPPDKKEENKEQLSLLEPIQ